MDLLRSFRFSTYVTLGIACLCLDYAEGGLLPETPFITTGVIILLAVAYRLEGRWSLTLHAANMVGALLTLLLVGWIAFQIVRKPTPVLSQIPFPTSLLPYLGPVLMILIPAKLFRPKHVGDFWAMQGIGLLAVALGCAMANDVYFGFLLIIYICGFIWSLSLFYLYREVRPDRNSATAEVVRSGRRLYMLRTTWRWSAAIASAGLLLFLVTPRPQNKSWELPMRMHGKMEMGLSDGLDLNRTGSLESNKDVAFEVYAEDLNRKPKLDLNPSQRWRSRPITSYQNGKWAANKQNMPYTVLDRTRTPNTSLSNPADRFALMAATLPNLGSNRYFLSYTIHANASGSNILADPVLWRPSDSPPIYAFGVGRGGVQQQLNGEFEVPRDVMNSDRPSYCQVYVPTKEPDLGVQLAFAPTQMESLTQLPTNLDRDRLRTWTNNVLALLVKREKLSSRALTEREGDDLFAGFDHLAWIDNVLSLLRRQNILPVAPVQGGHTIMAKHHEAVARALEDYFAHAGDFVYTLNLDRKDQGIDPVEDFLYNTRVGHCQRFATALVIVLRNLGIPSQIVTGYRGCESRNDGWYDVKQYHAHVWAEVLVKRSPPTGVIPRRVELPYPQKESRHWLSLDPTPESDPAAENEKATNWLQSTLERGESFFKFILLYDSSAREGALNAIVVFIEDTQNDLEEGRITQRIGIIGAVILFIPTVFVVRSMRRRRRIRRAKDPAADHAAIVPIYQRLLGLLAKYQWIPRAGETAKEFVSRVHLNMSNHKGLAHAGILAEIVEAYYRVRFGGHALSDPELLRLDEGIDRLEAGLAPA